MGHFCQYLQSKNMFKYLVLLCVVVSVFGEPEAAPEAEADPYYLYGGYGLGYYGRGLGYYGYGLGHGYAYYGKKKRPAEPEPKAEADPYLLYGGYYGHAGYYGKKKRSAEAEPKAEAEADPYLLYGGYYGHAGYLGHAGYYGGWPYGYAYYG